MLPAELRLKIYKSYFEDIDSTRDVSLSNLRTFVPLLQSNSLIRSEAAPMFYKEYIARQNLRNRLVFSFSHIDEVALLRGIGALCSLISLYSANLQLTIVLEKDSGLETLSRPFLETFLDLMAQNARVNKRILGEYKNMWFGSAPGTRWQHFGFEGNIGGFTFRYISGSEDDDYGFYLDGPVAETFEVGGPLAQLDWSKVSGADL